MMRKESIEKRVSNERPQGAAVDEVRLAAKDHVQVLASGASTLEESAKIRAKLKAHLTSKAQLRQNFQDVSRLMSEIEKEDTVVDGFVQERVSLAERVNWLKLKKREENKRRHDMANLKVDPEPKKSDAEVLLEQQSIAAENARTLEINERTSTFGYWAENRPHELRLDPDNMKVYSFSTWKLRYPNKHSYSAESSFKKLPKAPHRVKLNKHAVAPDGLAPAALLDEHDEPLIFTKDSRGFYHQGRHTLTEEEIMKVQRPQDYNRRLLQREEHKNDKPGDEEKYQIFANETAKLRELVSNFKGSQNLVEKENHREALDHLRTNIAYTLGIQPKAHVGRTTVDIRGHAGNLASFHLLINKVTTKALKQQIEKKTAIPWEAQHLYLGTHELIDDELLSKHMTAGHVKAIDLIEANHNIMKEALQKRGLWKAPVQHPIGKPVKTPSVSKAFKEMVKTHEENAKQEEALTAKPTEKAAEAVPAPTVTEAPVEAIAEQKSGGLKEHSAKHFHKKHHGKHHKAAGASLAEVDPEDDASDKESFAEHYTPAVMKPVVNSLAGHEIIARKRAERDAETKAPVVLRRTLYVREEDGTIHVEKQEVARPGHPIIINPGYSRNNHWGEIDRGIPVDVLLQEEDQEALKAEANDAHPPLPVSFYQANLQPSHGHRHQAHKAVAPPARKPKGNVVHKMNHAKKMKTTVLAKAAKAKRSLVKQAPKAKKASKPQRKAPHRVKMMK
jgi:hypothetical protein